MFVIHVHELYIYIVGSRNWNTVAKIVYFLELADSLRTYFSLHPYPLTHKWAHWHICDWPVQQQMYQHMHSCVLTHTDQDINQHTPTSQCISTWNVQYLSTHATHMFLSPHRDSHVHIHNLNKYPPKFRGNYFQVLMQLCFLLCYQRKWIKYSDILDSYLRWENYRKDRELYINIKGNSNSKCCGMFYKCWILLCCRFPVQV